jgi:ClpP class serine protease
LLPITHYVSGRRPGVGRAAGGERVEKLDARRREDPELMATAQSGRSEYWGPIVAGGIAIVSITGELVHRAGGVDAESGLLSYVDIEEQLDAALADPMVRGILLEIDSPGGEAAGAFTLADKVYNARTAKPIWALANEGAASAAYAIACACERVLLPESGHVGSIGVIWQALDQSRLDKAAGLQYAVIQYGARKNDFNPHYPISQDALAWATAEVDRLGEQFVALVARNRGLDPAAVRL